MEIWPTAAEVAGSDLSAWMFPHLKAPGRSERAGSLFVDLVTWYAGGECLFLASALARQGGGSIVRFDRDVSGDELPLGHAVLVTGAGDDILSGTAHDILGSRPVRVLSTGLGVLGPLRPSLGEIVDPADFGANAERVALSVAGCLPWLRPFVPERFAVADADAWRCLEWVAANWGPLRDGMPGADARWIQSLPALGSDQILGEPQPMLS